MPKDMRKKLFILLALGSLTGCHCLCPRWQLRQSQLRAYQAYNQSQMLASELGQSQQMASQLSTEKQLAEARAAELQRNLSVANERLNNLAQERTKLHDEYKHLLTNMPAPGNSLTNKHFEDLCRKYPQFEFDPITGVSRFNADIVFDSGSNQLTPEGLRTLQEFARIMNDGDARQFNVLVVGHTDDEPVVQPTTRAKHETNWELSAHRATAVVRQLGKYGVSEPRMGVAGYNMYQPAVPNTNDGMRSKNRRVELFVLAPDASIAGRDSNVSQR
ncbi:OmpA/MotB family protein [Planctomicrobium piriforme]|uniref:Chemotaxis protein MotB n=1 Tax=Planctomicrobium piriforme TaxID=1576369 RepID=A0A1I3NPM5_9PLAN|nr:OmpA family protein [Planctomicrobium piriforme]SFJ11268.1 chemotaxis protein MotB [Planctomicrobium piriforme]